MVRLQTYVSLHEVLQFTVERGDEDDMATRHYALLLSFIPRAGKAARIWI